MPPYYPDIDLVREEIAHHYDCILETDRQIGEVVRALKADGMLDGRAVAHDGVDELDAFGQVAVLAHEAVDLAFAELADTAVDDSSEHAPLGCRFDHQTASLGAVACRAIRMHAIERRVLANHALERSVERS